MKGRVIAVTVTGLVMVLLLILGTSFLECKDVEYETDASPEVNNDPYLAFDKIFSERFLIQRYSDLEDVDLESTSYLAIQGHDLSYFNAEDLSSWVQAGGRLQISFDEDVDLPGDDWWQESDLLSDLRPSFITSDPGELAQQMLSGNVVSETKADIGSSSRSISVDSFVGFDHVWRFKNTTLVSKGKKTYAVLRNYGKGFVLVSGKPFFMMNRFLRDSENLDFAAALVRGLNGNEKYILIPSAQNPAAAGAKKIESEPIIWSIAGLCLLIFWWALPRRGPVLPETKSDQRSLRERFIAEGRFLWRYGAGASIIARLSSQIMSGPKSPANAAINTPVAAVEVAARTSLKQATLSKQQFIRDIGTEVRKRMDS